MAAIVVKSDTVPAVISGEWRQVDPKISDSPSHLFSPGQIKEGAAHSGKVFLPQ